LRAAPLCVSRQSIAATARPTAPQAARLITATAFAPRPTLKPAHHPFTKRYRAGIYTTTDEQAEAAKK
jgi:hypothetical protein